MDTLHSVLRSFRGETKSGRDHLEVFRKFLQHLDRASRRKGVARVGKSARPKAKRGKR